MIVAGLMSGTSVDALDIAVVDLEPDGSELVMQILAHREVAFPADLGEALLEVLQPHPIPMSLVGRVDTDLGRFSADALAAVLEEEGLDCDLVVSHGQTIYHWIEDGVARGTLQVGQPAWIAERVGTPVLSDVRVRDLTVGGQGAPLASTLDTLLLTGEPTPTAALNLGGIANITVVAPGTDPIAYDTGPANALIDAMARRITGGALAFDRGGELAAAGKIQPELLSDLLADPYYAAAPPKSTGKELFHEVYLDRALARHADTSPLDVIATVTALTARTVAQACLSHGVTQVLASGGGTRNPILMDQLGTALGEDVRLDTTDAIGLPSEAKEACLMALLGWLSWHGLPATVASCTGARRATVAGRLTPGSGPLRLPDPHPHPPTRLRITTPRVR